MNGAVVWQKTDQLVSNSNFFLLIQNFTVADPGFPRSWGANSHDGGANLLFVIMFPKNCMKMKEIEPGGGAWCPWQPSMKMKEIERGGGVVSLSALP